MYYLWCNKVEQNRVACALVAFSMCFFRRDEIKPSIEYKLHYSSLCGGGVGFTTVLPIVGIYSLSLFSLCSFLFFFLFFLRLFSHCKKMYNKSSSSSSEINNNGVLRTK